MSETTYRSGHRKGYTVILRDVAQDGRLSLKARGLFLLMQSLPDNWSYTLSGLSVKANCGRDQLRAALKELETVGYLVKEQTHDESGRFSGAVYLLREDAPEDPVQPAPETPQCPTETPPETPQCPPENPALEAARETPLTENPTTAEAQKPPLSGNPITGKPTTEKPSSGNPTVNNKDINTQDQKNPPNPPMGGGVKRHKSAARWKPERFERFWEFYRTHGRGQAKDKAVRAWDRLKPDDALIEAMGRALRKQIAGEDWRRGIGIPYASTWLNGRRWEDDPPPERTVRAPDAGLPAREAEAFGVWT